MNKIYNYFLIHYSPVQPLPQNSTLYSFYYQLIHSYEVRKSLTIACTPEFRYFSCTFFHFCYESKARNLRASSFTYVFSISLIFKCLFHSQAVFFLTSCLLGLLGSGQPTHIFLHQSLETFHYPILHLFQESLSKI